MKGSFLFLFLCLSFQAVAQDRSVAPAGLEEARAVRQIVREKGLRWFEPFRESFLGVNHERTQPEISKLLNQVVRATSDAQLRRSLSSYDGAAPVAQILELAKQEMKTWRPGNIPHPSTLQTLWTQFNSSPPGRGLQHRLERYRVPQGLSEWLFEEQVMNEKIVEGGQVQGGVDIGTLPAELDPLRRPQYWLAHVEIPLEEAVLFRADPLSSRVSSQLFVKRGGRTYVRYFIHPASVESPSIRRLIEQYGVKVEYLAMPTASPRSLAVWNPRTNEPFLLLKLSLTSVVGGLRRPIWTPEGNRGTNATLALDQWTEKNGKSPVHLRESLAVYPAGMQFGMIVREPRPGFPSGHGTRWVPGSALMSRGPGRRVPLLVQMIRKSGEPPRDYVRRRLLEPYLKLYAELTYRQGLIGEPHQQNVLVQIGADGQLTGRLFLRDMDSFRLDAEMRVRQGVGMKGLMQYSSPTLVRDLQLGSARSLYDYSYQEYVRDWEFMLSKLNRYFPQITRESMALDMEEILRREVGRHLDTDTKSLTTIDLNALARDFRSRKGDAQALSRSHKSQKDLKEEFRRLSRSQRVQWIASNRRIDASATFLRHSGVIEMRKSGIPVGFAFLESEGTRSAPQPEYPGSAVSRWKPVLKEEAAGMAKFVLGFTIKEGIDGAMQGEGDRWAGAFQEVTRPESVRSLGYFTLGAQSAHFSVGRWLSSAKAAGVPKPVQSFLRSTAGLMLGTIAAEAGRDQRDWVRAARTSGGMLLGSTVVTALTRPLDRILGVSRPGRALIDIGRIVLTLHSAEWLERHSCRRPMERGMRESR